MTEKQYPELPDFETVEQHVYGACHRYVSQDMLEPIHNLIRDGIDADRAMRAVGAVPDGLPLVIAGAIYDFAGFLTTRPQVIPVGASAEATPIADLVKEWAAKRGLSLKDAAVLSWQELLTTHQEAVPRDKLAKRMIGEVLEADAIATSVCRTVAELSDRNIPQDWPEPMLVTADELHQIVREAVIAAQQRSK